MINLSYTGSCSIDGKVIMCSSMSSSLDQKLLFFDHSQGLRDKFIKGQYGLTKGPATRPNLVTQKKTYRLSPAIAHASVSAPIPVDGFQEILDKAISGEELEITIVYHRKNAPEAILSKAIITSLSIDLKAGDIATFNMEVIGAEYSFGSSGNGSNTADCSKLITWDACTVEPSGISNNISTFNISINNPAVPIYTSKWTKDTETNGMMPQKIRLGIQEVTGSIGFYGSVDLSAPTTGTIKFSFNGSGKTVAVAFFGPKDDASAGPYIKSISFIGVKDGTIWS